MKDHILFALSAAILLSAIYLNGRTLFVTLKGVEEPPMDSYSQFHGRALRHVLTECAQVTLASTSLKPSSLWLSIHTLRE